MFYTTQTFNVFNKNLLATQIFDQYTSFQHLAESLETLKTSERTRKPTEIVKL